MKLKPLYDKIVVKREGSDEKVGSLIIPDNAKEKPQRGTVVAVGQGKRCDDGTLVPLDVKPGDKILFGKFSGSDVKVGEEELAIMTEGEVLAIVEE